MIRELLARTVLSAPATQRACPVTRPAARSGRYGTRRLWTFCAAVFPSAGCWRITGRGGPPTLWHVGRPTTLSSAVRVVAS